MKLATGIDLLEIARIQEMITRHGDRFLERVFTFQELADCRGNAASLAGRFAAKEAASKALGTGIGPVGWRDLEIGRGPAREPILILHGAAQDKAAELGLTTWSVSITHTSTHALAMAVAAGESATPEKRHL
jgi:holo-[acyl-carrier protein] synthase